MDIVNQAYMLALSYRFTVIINIENRHLETDTWMSSWHADLRGCIERWCTYPQPQPIAARRDGAIHRNPLPQMVYTIINAFPINYTTAVGNGLTPDQALHGYAYVHDILARLAFASEFADYELSEFFELGQQLAHNDLRAYFATGKLVETDSTKIHTGGTLDGAWAGGIGLDDSISNALMDASASPEAAFKLQVAARGTAFEANDALDDLEFKFGVQMNTDGAKEGKSYSLYATEQASGAKYLLTSNWDGKTPVIDVNDAQFSGSLGDPDVLEALKGLAITATGSVDFPTPDLRVIVTKPFTPLTGASFPRTWSMWPQDQNFNKCVSQYVNNRVRFTSAASFSMGALAQLALAILCPEHFPSTVWCWQDWNQAGARKTMWHPWHLLFAGNSFQNAPTYIWVKDRNDTAFVKLFKKMEEHKKESRDINECGWIQRKELWSEIPVKDTRKKAWIKLTTKTLPKLGKFGAKGGVGKYKNKSVPVRAPAALAEPDCLIFIERLKKE